MHYLRLPAVSNTVEELGHQNFGNSGKKEIDVFLLNYEFYIFTIKFGKNY